MKITTLVSSARSKTGREGSPTSLTRLEIKTLTYTVVHGSRAYQIKMHSIVGLRLREKVRVNVKKSK